MNIVKKVIEDMGGEIIFKKNPTTFILRVKAHEPLNHQENKK
jgi:hypothetical protein